MIEGPHGHPDRPLWPAVTYYDMRSMRGKGSQKKARLERLKSEIVEYIEQMPGASAADIVAFLSNERKMRNHGLTTRKVGLFIPLHLSEKISFRLDASTGKRIYHVAA
jgi:hypothetical protein